MTILTPLGLIALASIVALIIIYIIRPNYQQKFLSTTFVWKLSLKYKRKRIPTSKLRNIILIICQVLILALSTAILTTPSKILKVQIENEEVILVIDSSASMRTFSDGKTRYERALELAEIKANDVINKQGSVSLIIADENPHFEFTGIGEENRLVVDDAFYALGIEDGCSYGSADIQRSVDLCADIFLDNPSAKIFIYTDEQYGSDPPAGINVVDVTDRENEWNAAVLDVRAEKINGYYMFIAEVASYNRNSGISVLLTVNGANVYASGGGRNFSKSANVDCVMDRTMTVVFASNEVHTTEINNYALQEDAFVEIIENVDSFKSVNVSLGVTDDNLTIDNSYNIYGGVAEDLNVEYYSKENNTFFNVVLDALRDRFSVENKWSMHVAEKSVSSETMGYDFYIFEESMPDVLPTDGVVLLVNPDKAPMLSGFDVTGELRSSSGELIPLAYGENDSHPLLKNVRPEAISVTRFMRIDSDGGEYEVLMTCAGRPVVMVRNEGSVKIVVVAFSLHYSDFSQKLDFPLFMLNLFDYFFPVTVEKTCFEVGEKVTLNSRGAELTVGGYDSSEKFDEFPATTSFDMPGVYELSQRTYFGKQVVENVYVKSPVVESNIFREPDALINPYTGVNMSDFYQDLLLYFAIALMALTFVEWILQSLDNM